MLQGDYLLAIIRLGIGFEFNSNILNISQDINWNYIKAIAMRQGLLGIIVDGVEKLSEDQRPPQTLLLQWIGQTVEGYENRYEPYCRTIAEMAGWYNRHGYKMMLLKGLACGMDWPKPKHRPYGDIDIWLFGNQKEADEALAKELNIKIDNSHHHHTIFNWNGFMVENHYDFINVHHYKSSRELENIFKELGQDDSRFIMMNGQKVYTPSPNLHALFLIRHMVSHFSSIQLNLRQILDWGFFVEKHGDEVDWVWLLPVLDQYHMKNFFDCINAICVNDLGFANTNYTNGSLRSKSLENLKERILKDILSPEFDGVQPQGLIHRVPFKYRRWKANAWKRELCYAESERSSFWGGVWNHMLKPASI